MSTAIVQVKRPRQRTGFAFWMERVLEECEAAGAGFAPDPVHDLRVALRRCRSMADGVMAVDPDPAWREMKKAGKRLFSRLGDLRDMQVMEEWLQRLGSPEDPVTGLLLQHLRGREAGLKAEATTALQAFDRKQWKHWSSRLARRGARVRPGSAIFLHLALQRWDEAYQLHRQALRRRSRAAWHQLRIGIKRLRYIVENFLPEQHKAWKDDLKELQDLLGEVHDLDVLWATALQVGVFADAESRSRWHQRILEEHDRRIVRYREMTLGESSLWQSWRAGLPQGKEIAAAALTRLKLWARLRDPDFKHSQHVARLALQLHEGIVRGPRGSRERAILRLAALLHDVGLVEKKRAHHKISCRLIGSLGALPGWSEGELQRAARVARYHRGALPQRGQKTLQGLSQDEVETVTRLAAVLRLANAFDGDHSRRIRQLSVRAEEGQFTVEAQGYSPSDQLAEAIASARHLLETVYQRPVMIKPSPTRGRRRSPRHPQSPSQRSNLRVLARR